MHNVCHRPANSPARLPENPSLTLSEVLRRRGGWVGNLPLLLRARRDRKHRRVLPMSCLLLSTKLAEVMVGKQLERSSSCQASIFVCHQQTDSSHSRSRGPLTASRDATDAPFCTLTPADPSSSSSIYRAAARTYPVVSRPRCAAARITASLPTTRSTHAGPHIGSGSPLTRRCADFFPRLRLPWRIVTSKFNSLFMLCLPASASKVRITISRQGVYLVNMNALRFKHGGCHSLRL
ncbi:hypothetical protein V8E36_006904 [Tilletia maclaganii]